ncbi:MAG: glutamate--cysteine ligase [Oleiphilaceae bacterium]|jgi:glutamate--cysteine ligase
MTAPTISTCNLSPEYSDKLSKLEHYVSSHGIPVARGIEKEGLRTDERFDISQLNHPEALGHPLTHPSITTDYSEALLELITPVEKTRDGLLNTLEDTHRHVANNMGDELLWAGSMPCRIDGNDSIRIAEYGDSNLGQLKHTYRQGLGVRYGRIMQSIAGLHYNFSISDDFWRELKNLKHDPSDQNAPSLKDFKSEQYFALIRNFRRHAWLLMYLFGASPALDKSFLAHQKHTLEPFDDQGTFYKPYATSLRMGDLGYQSNAQSSLAICFNTLSNFTHTLGEAITTPYPAYEAIGTKKDNTFIQLNTNILQIENEYYSSIRPKRSAGSNEKPRQALNEHGVEYIEVRCLDLNPFLPLGISPQQVDFMDIFLLHCLLTDSPYINDEECKTLNHNFDLVVNEGRRPDLMIKCHQGETLMQTCGKQLLDSMSSLAKTLDQAESDSRYQNTLIRQQKIINAPELSPSAQVLSTMKKDSASWLEFAGQLSKKHKLSLTQNAQNHPTNFIASVQQSFNDARSIKQNDTLTYEQFIHDYQTK